MGVIFQQGADTTALTLNNTSSVSAALNRPANNAAPMVACVLNNDDAEAIFIKFGASGLSAAATDAPVMVGERAFFMVPQGATHVAAVAAGTADGSVYVTLGYAGE
ncbi:MAG: hypothetical protein ACFCUR_20945 [Rhodomicrobiaceae bacterium]